MTHKIWADFEQQIILLKMREIVYRISPEHNYAIATGVMTTIPAQGGERKPAYKKAYSHFFTTVLSSSQAPAITIPKDKRAFSSSPLLCFLDVIAPPDTSQRLCK